MIVKPDIVTPLGFTDEEISLCLKRNGLLSIELEFTRNCNLRCIYCYSNAGRPSANELDIEELKSVITEAAELGATKIILLGGGEPLLYDRFEDIVRYINSLGLKQILFTNGTLINKKIAQLLFRNMVSVIVKHNSFNPEIQDKLAGSRGAFTSIQHGLKLLLESGYPHSDAELGIQSVICRQNIGELPAMWAWARENGIIPYFEVLTLQGRAKENDSLRVSAYEIKAVFEHLKNIDTKRYGMKWILKPNIAAFSCKRHLYSCLINSHGDVQPCTGIDFSVGNIRNESLKNILGNSVAIKKLRNVYENLEGYCSECEYGRECYGCRGNAYQITGNYLASDPTCWRYKNGVVTS